MLGAFALIVAGSVACGWGVRTALAAPRPASLGGALTAAVGLAAALAGATRLVVPTFF